MLNILKQKQTSFFDKEISRINKPLSPISQKKEDHKNVIYYPSSNKEWFNNIYSYNKLYTKPLITYHFLINNLFKSYLNMSSDKIKILFKRGRANRKRYSANKIFVSRTEVKHTNSRILIILYTYNKQKSLIEQEYSYIFRWIPLNKRFYFNKIYSIRNKIGHLLKKRFFFLNKGNTFFIKSINNLIHYSAPDNKIFKKQKLTMYETISEKKLSTFKKEFIKYTKAIIFNKFKCTNFLLNLTDLGITSLIKRLYGKNVELKIVELRSIHLSSDLFSSAIALKLRDRKNKALNILRDAISSVKLPDFHTLLTYDDSIKKITKSSILDVIKQQVVSGVRFEASGRLTRRLTAMRSVYKYRYLGSLKDIRSSYSKKPSTLLRGHVKSNSQYTLVSSKTRNGAFGLKGWVSSH